MRLELLDHLGRGLAPELLLVLGRRLAEAVEAERAELGGILGVVRAPDGAGRLELAEAVPAADEVTPHHASG